MDINLIIAGSAFVLFVGAMLFYLHTENQQVTRERAEISDLKARTFTCEGRVKELRDLLAGARSDIDDMKKQVCDLHTEVARLHESHSNMISVQREVALRVDSAEKLHTLPRGPQKIEVTFGDPRSTVTKKAGKIVNTFTKNIPDTPPALTASKKTRQNVGKKELKNAR